MIESGGQPVLLPERPKTCPPVLLQTFAHLAGNAGAAHMLPPSLPWLACMLLHSMPVRLVRCSSCQHSATLETICFMDFDKQSAYILLIVEGWCSAGGVVLQISFR